MKLTNKSYIFLTIFFFSACVAKKSTIEYKDRVVKDTVYKNITKTILKPIKDTLLIEQPCDTNGVLKPFKTILKNEKATIVIENVKGNIKATVNIDSILQIKEQEYKSKYRSKVEIKEVDIVKYKVPFYHWLIHIICGLLIFLLLKIR